MNPIQIYHYSSEAAIAPTDPLSLHIHVQGEELYCIMTTRDAGCHAMATYRCDWLSEEAGYRDLLQRFLAGGDHVPARVILTAGDPGFVLLPSGMPEDILKSGLLPDLPGRAGMYMGLSETSLRLHYQFPAPLLAVCRALFPDLETGHQTGYAWREILPWLRKASCTIWVGIAGDTADVIVRAEGQPVFVNRFALAGENDLLYYLGAAIQRYGPVSEEGAILVSGLLTEDSRLLQEIRYAYGPVHKVDLPGMLALSDLPDMVRPLLIYSSERHADHIG